MSKETDVLGAWGERVLDRWALALHAPTARPYPDKFGWDRLVEFPHPTSQMPSPLVTGGTRGGTTSCLFQVKATRNARLTGMNLELPRWSQLAHSPLPAFFLVLVQSGLDHVSSAYLVHLDRAWIELVLQGEMQAAQGRLTKKSLRLKWNEKDRLQPMDMRDEEYAALLRPAIDRHVGPDLERYAREKLTVLSTAGYPPVPYKGTVKFQGSSADAIWGELSDLAIGAVDRVPFMAIEASVTRFDTTLKVPPLESKDGTAVGHVTRLPGQNPTAAAVVRSLSLGETCTLPGTIAAAASMFPSLPEQHHKIRFTGEYFSCTLVPTSPTAATAHWRFEVPQRFKFGPAALVGKLIRVLNSGEVEGEIAVQEGQTLSLSGTPTFDSNDPSIALLLERAWAIGTAGGLPPSAEFSLKEAWAARVTIAEIAASLSGAGSDASIDCPNLPWHPSSPRVAGLFLRHLMTSQWVLLALLAVEGDAIVVPNGELFHVSVASGTASVVRIEAHQLSQLDFSLDTWVSGATDKFKEAGTEVILSTELLPPTEEQLDWLKRTYGPANAGREAVRHKERNVRKRKTKERP